METGVSGGRFLFFLLVYGGKILSVGGLVVLSVSGRQKVRTSTMIPP